MSETPNESYSQEERTPKSTAKEVATGLAASAMAIDKSAGVANLATKEKHETKEAQLNPEAVKGKYYKIGDTIKKLGKHSHYIDKSGNDISLKYTSYPKGKCDMEVVQINKKENKSSRAILRVDNGKFNIYGFKNGVQISGLANISPNDANKFLEKVQGRLSENKEYNTTKQKEKMDSIMNLAQITDGNEADDLLKKIEGGEYDMA